MLSNIMQFISIVQSCAEHVSTIQCIHCQYTYLQLQLFTDTSEIKDYFYYCNKDFYIVGDKVLVDVIEWIAVVRI